MIKESYRQHSLLKKYVNPLLGVCCLGLFACSSSRVYHTTVVSGNEYHNSYDDTTLTPDNSSILMPYNRFIDPAGTVIRFGNYTQENHSLDCILLPSGNVLAVEDRYGLVFLDVQTKKIIMRLDYGKDPAYRALMSTYSGLKAWKSEDGIHIFWGASNPGTKASYVMEALWDGSNAILKGGIPFKAEAPAPMSLPNDISISQEGNETYMYVVLNGNSQLSKIRLKHRQTIWTAPTGMAPFGVVVAAGKIYVTNWAGPQTDAGSKEPVAGIPNGSVNIDPRTGATARGTVSVLDLQTGRKLKEVEVGLHPNAIIASPDQQFVYVSNGNSDHVSVIRTGNDEVLETISVKLNGTETSFVGDSPNALAVDQKGTTLYVANGMDNAICVVQLGATASTSGKGKSHIKGFIPTEAYPAGMALTENMLYVANLEGEGARASKNKTYSDHQQEATISIIPLPDETTLKAYTTRVEKANLVFRTKLAQLAPRKGIAPKPVPERIGEPSVFKHVVYIIKENKTYDQVLGDMPEGNGMKSLCIFGEDVTPNEHKLAREFHLLDNYYVSGKSSAEGHSWTDAAIVTDYVEKNVRAWFRSYPHVLADALVYNKEGFIWNNALDHGKTVRIYGEACTPEFNNRLGWKDIYQSYLNRQPFEFTNTTTISRVAPILSPAYPCFENQKINDQIRADVFIKELQEYEQMPGDQLPQLMILALPSDHTAGMREGFPTPRAMVADNDLALGRIVEALTKSRFWDSTAVFVTEDDSQSGWDHVSGYRTTGFILSPYSHLKKTVHTNYNQTCMVRTIEQILGIPPMNIMDATALPMFDCFSSTPVKNVYVPLKNNVPLDEMNKATAELKGKALHYARLSSLPQFNRVDGGDDDLLNRILWYAAKGNVPYPKGMILPKKERKDDDD